MQYKSILSQLLNNYFSPTKKPKCCSSVIKHGCYTRYCEVAMSRISIQRFLCKACHKTLSCLPDGLISYFQSSLNLICNTLTYRFQHGRWPYYTKRQRAGHWLNRLLRFSARVNIHAKAEEILEIAFYEKRNFLE
jgi:hypothetical protein